MREPAVPVAVEQAGTPRRMRVFDGAPELGTSSEHLPESTREELGTTVRVRLVLFDPVWRHKTKLILSSSKPEDADANWHPQETLEQAIATVVKTDAGKLLIDKIKKGITTYKAENITWMETSYATSANAATSDLSKIDSPSGNPPSINGNWRLTNATANKSDSGRFWTITKTWTASDVGAKWDEDLYN